MDISTVLRKDRTYSTYKFALLRGTIDICQRNPHLARREGGRAWFPMGMLVERWLEYYYPIIDSPDFIPQSREEDDSPSSRKMRFRDDFTAVVDHYSRLGGMDAFFYDLRTSRVPDELTSMVWRLVRNIARTIADQPMKHLGHSVTGEQYSVFRFSKGSRVPKRARLDLDQMNRRLGEFSISDEMMSAFDVLGAYINGEDSIIQRWADFTVGTDPTGGLTKERVLTLLTTRPSDGREVSDAKAFYLSLLGEGGLECVWSGRRIGGSDVLHVDHVLPFSVMRNNDLWNLMPSLNAVNKRKRDMVPSPELIHDRSGALSDYWDRLHGEYPVRFEKEVRLSLDMREDFHGDWGERMVESLKARSEHLIVERGEMVFSM